MPNNEIQDSPILKGFADDFTDVTQKLEFTFVKVVSIWGKRRKCWLPAVSPVSPMFSIAPLFQGHLKVVIVCGKGKIAENKHQFLARPFSEKSRWVLLKPWRCLCHHVNN